MNIDEAVRLYRKRGFCEKDDDVFKALCKAGYTMFIAWVENTYYCVELELKG